MTGFFEDDWLRFEGLSDQQIAEINAFLPVLQQILTLAKPHMTAVIAIIQTIVAKQQELK